MRHIRACGLLSRSDVLLGATLDRSALALDEGNDRSPGLDSERTIGFSFAGRGSWMESTVRVAWPDRCP